MIPKKTSMCKSKRSRYIQFYSWLYDWADRPLVTELVKIVIIDLQMVHRHNAIDKLTPKRFHIGKTLWNDKQNHRMRGSAALLQRRQFRMAKIRTLISSKWKKTLREMQTLRTAYAGESVLHLCTKFEADCSSRSKVIKGVQKLGNKVTWPRPRPLVGRLWSLRRQCPSSMSVPNLKRVALYVQKLLGDPNVAPPQTPSKHTHKHTNRQDRLQYTASLSLARSVKKCTDQHDRLPRCNIQSVKLL